MTYPPFGGGGGGEPGGAGSYIYIYTFTQYGSCMIMLSLTVVDFVIGGLLACLPTVATEGWPRSKGLFHTICMIPWTMGGSCAIYNYPLSI